MDGEGFAFPGPDLSSERLAVEEGPDELRQVGQEDGSLACLMLPGGENPDTSGKWPAAPVLGVQIAPIDRRRADADAGESVPWNGGTRARNQDP